MFNFFMKVSLDYKVKEKMFSEKQNPPRTIFDEAQTKIYSLMHRDSFPRLSIKMFLS